MQNDARQLGWHHPSLSTFRRQACFLGLRFKCQLPGAFILTFSCSQPMRPCASILCTQMDRCFLQCFAFFSILDFSPDLECETSQSPVPSPLFSNSLTKFPLEVLVHPENPSADLVSPNSEPTQTGCKVLWQHPGIARFEEKFQQFHVRARSH